VPDLLAEGRLDRARRALRLAADLCSGAEPTWTVELATLTELGALDEARTLARTVLASTKATTEATHAARAALASSAARPDPDALVLAGRAAQARGDAPGARRLFDRARVAALRVDPSADPCALDDRCAGEIVMPQIRAEPILGMAFSPASRLLAVNRQDGLSVFDLDGRIHARITAAPERAPEQMAFSPDGHLLVTTPPSFQSRRGAELLDAETGARRSHLPDLPDRRGRHPTLASLCISPDGKLLAGAVSTRKDLADTSPTGPWELGIWDLGRGTRLVSTEVGGPVRGMAFAGPSKVVLLLEDAARRSIELRETRAGRLLRNLPTDPKIALSSPALSVSPDGTSLTGIFDGAWRILDLGSGELRARLPHASLQGPRIEAGSIAFSPDGSLALLDVNDLVEVAEIATGKSLASLRPPKPGSPVDGAAFLDARGIVVLGGGVLETWDIGTSAPIRRAGPPFVPFSAVAFAPDDASLAAGLDDGDVALLDLGAPGRIRRLPGHSAAVTGLSFSRDGASLVSASRDGTLRLWDRAAATASRVLAGHAGPVTAVVVAPDEDLIASASEDRTVRLWALSSGAEIRRLVQPAVPSALAFSPDGKKLAVGLRDGTVAVLDAASGATLGTASASPSSARTADPIRTLIFAGDPSADPASWLARIPFASPTTLPAFVERPLWALDRAAARAEDGRTLAQAGPPIDPSLLLVDPTTGKLARRIETCAQPACAEGAALAISSAGDLAAWATYEGLALVRTSASDHAPDLVIRVVPRFAGGLVLASDGTFDFAGPDSNPVRRAARCIVAGRSRPFELCEERLHVPGLLARVLDGDASTGEP
jgi:WD40 repeat protein